MKKFLEFMLKLAKIAEDSPAAVFGILLVLPVLADGLYSLPNLAADNDLLFFHAMAILISFIIIVVVIVAIFYYLCLGATRFISRSGTAARQKLEQMLGYSDKILKD